MTKIYSLNEIQQIIENGEKESIYILSDNSSDETIRKWYIQNIIEEIDMYSEIFHDLKIKPYQINKCSIIWSKKET